MWGWHISNATVQLGRTHPARDEKLESCVKHIIESEGIPAFVENVKQTMARSINLETASSMELARIILKDLGLTSLVLRIANSALYNSSDRNIMSVAHAIALLGWDKVRNMLGTIRYIEHFAKSSPGLREMMLVSVLDALHCRDIAAAAHYPHPDEAYICGLFRNLGEVLVACHYPHEYASTILAMHTDKIPARAACLRYLDFSWDDVGQLVSEAWNMPPCVSLCMQATSPPGVSPLDRSLVSITDFSHEMTHALYRRGEPIDSFRLRYVIDPNGGPTLLSLHDLSRIADSAATEIREAFLQFDIPKEKLLLEQQAVRARQILEATPVFNDAGLAALDHAVETVRLGLTRDDFELTAVMAFLLDAVCAAGFDCAVFGLLNEAQNVVRGRLASGGSADVLERFQFTVDRTEGPIRTAMVGKTDVLVDRARDDRYDRSALVTAFEPAIFALLPIITDGRALACLYAHRGTPSPGVNLLRSHLGRVRDVMATAIRRKGPQSAAGAGQARRKP